MPHPQPHDYHNNNNNNNNNNYQYDNHNIPDHTHTNQQTMGYPNQYESQHRRPHPHAIPPWDPPPKTPPGPTVGTHRCMPEMTIPTPQTTPKINSKQHALPPTDQTTTKITNRANTTNNDNHQTTVPLMASVAGLVYIKMLRATCHFALRGATYHQRPKHYQHDENARTTTLSSYTKTHGA